MILSKDILTKFAKITNDEKSTETDQTVYGTITKSNGKTFVKIDGSDILTPVSTTAETEDNERVIVQIKNHSAIVIGNMSSPSVRSETVKDLSDKFNELNLDSALIKEIQADNIQINNKLTAFDGKFLSLETGKLDVQVANATYATIENLTATNTHVYNLESTYATFTTTVTNKFTAVDAEIEKRLKATDIEGKYANIDFSNISEATIEKFYLSSGLIENVIIQNGIITGDLQGVSISGNLIKGNTIVADKLILLGDDGLYYKLNTSGDKVESSQTDYNSLNGEVIKAKTITANKISVSDLVSFGATIGGFKITENSLYSGVKESINNTTNGVYLGKDGQMVVGNASDFIKFYKDSDNNYKLDISASVITFGTDKKNITDLINSVKVGGRNLTTYDDIDVYVVNLVRQTLNKDSYLTTGKFTYSRQGTTNLGFYATRFNRMEPDTEYVLSFQTKVISGVVNTFYFYSSNPDNIEDAKVYIDGVYKNTKNATIPIDMSDGEYHEFVIKFKTISSISSGTYYGNILQFNKSINVDFGIELKNLKLEKGTVQTDWTPAPEDIDSRFNSVEQKLTSSSLITTISTAIDNGNELETTQFVMNNTGFTIKNGSLIIQNNTGDDVITGDQNGNLLLNGGNFKIVNSRGGITDVVSFDGGSMGPGIKFNVGNSQYGGISIYQSIDNPKTMNIWAENVSFRSADGSNPSVGGIGVFNANSITGNDVKATNKLYVGSSDVVSRHGDSSSGYIRYYDGTQICYGTQDYSDSNLALTNNMANAVYSNDECKSIDLTFPAAFIDIPMVISDCRGGGYLNSQASYVEKTKASFRIWANYSATSSNVILQYVAIGRWK